VKIPRPAQHWAEGFFREGSLLQDLAEGACGLGTRVHCDRGVPPVRLAKDLVTAGLEDLCEPGAEQLGKDLTGGGREPSTRSARLGKPTAPCTRRPAAGSLDGEANCGRPPTRNAMKETTSRLTPLG
jgi:hypothetical protein